MYMYLTLMQECFFCVCNYVDAVGINGAVCICSLMQELLKESIFALLWSIY